MYRIGVIGLGKIAMDKHLPTIRAHRAFTLAGMADLRGDFAADNVSMFRSHAAMLSDLPNLDAVAICTPPRARCRVALDALHAGLHVLVEKPPTATIGEMLLLRDAVARTGRVLFTAWHSQYNAAVDAARARLAGETVAELSVSWKEDVHKWHPGQEWIWRAGGFGVFDAGINALSILTRILPQPLFVREAELYIPASADTPIAANIIFDLGSGEGRAIFDWRSTPDDQREIMITTHAGTVLHLAASARRLIVDGVIVVDTTRTEYPHLYDHFAALLRTGTSDVDFAPLVLAIDALQLGRRIAVEGVG